MRAIHSTCFALAIPLTLAACGSSAPKYTRPVTDTEAPTAMSECDYQIRLNKTAKADQEELRNLCMQAKGYRSDK